MSNTKISNLTTIPNIGDVGTTFVPAIDTTLSSGSQNIKFTVAKVAASGSYTDLLNTPNLASYAPLGSSESFAWTNGIDWSLGTVTNKWLQLGSVFSIDASGNSISNSLRIGGNSGPTWTSGAGAPSSTQPLGSLYSNTGGAVGTTLYVSRGGGTWTTVPSPHNLISTIYTASGAIAVTDSYALINSSSNVLMTLANGTVEGATIMIKRFGAGTVGVTAVIDGVSQTVAMTSAGTIKENLILSWSNTLTSYVAL